MISVDAAATTAHVALRERTGTGRSQLRALTGIRFVAALHVLVFHTMPWRSWAVPVCVRNVASCGYVAVSLFFILSGFILTYAHFGHRAGPLDAKQFYLNRFARIYPAYLFGLAIGAPFFVGHTVRVHGTAVMLPQAMAVVALVQAYVPSWAMAWNPPAWSLSAEAFFYALFPFLAPRIVRCRGSTAAGVGIACYAVCLLVPLAYVHFAPDAPIEATPDSQAFWLGLLRYHPLVRLPEFVIGIVLGRWYLSRDPTRGFGFAPIASLGAAAALLVILAQATLIPYPVLHNGLLAPVFGLLIATLADGRGALAWLLSTRPLVMLGEASYSLYILHIPLLVLWSKVVPYVHGERLRSWVGSSFAFVLLAVAASLLCYFYVERPLRQRVLAVFRPGRSALGQVPREVPRF